MSIVEFFLNEANVEHFRGKKVLEVGSAYVNGSVRPIIERFCFPAEYIGVDIQPGKGVDVVLSAERLVDHFGPDTFDVVISTEMLEHVRDWRIVISNMKDVLKPGGYMYITTRSKGFPFHAHPYDCWRYEPEDMKQIFADFEIISLKKDPEPGVFLIARKLVNQKGVNLRDIALYSMILGKRTLSTPSPEDMPFYRRARLLVRGLLSEIYHLLINRASRFLT